MSRVIIRVGPGHDDELCFTLLRAPVPPADRKPRKLACTVADLPTGTPPPPPAGWVREYGRQLWSHLGTHPEVQRALSTAVNGPAGQVQSILFDLQDQRAELFHWEMLCDEQDRFLALTRAPIGRIAEPGIDLAGTTPEFDGELRITAVLSALGVPAEQEWTGLRDAVHAARDAGLPVTVRVLIGEGDLLDKVTEAAQREDGLTVQAVPDRAVDLHRAIAESRPHILHFFCHGSAEQGQPRLLVATGQDVEKLQLGPVTPSVRLHIDGLRDLLVQGDVWLVVLNCCQGGLAAPEVHSLAHALAAAGVPAAVGMRESVQALAAYEFSRVFYRELLDRLAAQLTPAGADRTIDWTHLLSVPRAALVESHGDDAGTFGEWTLPVLYTRFDPFTVRITADRPDPAARARRAVLEGLLQRLPPDTPPEAIAELRRLAGS
jgi:CHAT domain